MRIGKIGVMSGTDYNTMTDDVQMYTSTSLLIEGGQYIIWPLLYRFNTEL